MIDFSGVLEDCGGTLEKILSHKNDRAVLQMRMDDGSRRILRICSREIPAYRMLTGHTCPFLPKVYSTRMVSGLFTAEEEFADGVSLQEMIAGGARMNEERVRSISRKICAAASFLHAGGYIHRDIKPEHVLLTADGGLYLMDLDASMRIAPEKAEDTQLLGTAMYAAPEQFGLSRSDERTDIYALGILMNELLTGKHPAVIRYEEGPLKDIISRCIQINPADRYPCMDELEEALKTVPDGMPRAGRTPEHRFPGWKRAALAAGTLCMMMVALWILPGESSMPAGQVLQEPAMVEGTEYLQLYREGTRETMYHNFRLGAQSAALYTEDGVLVDETWNVYADSSIGFIEGWKSQYHGWTLVSEDCDMGASGYLHAEKDGKHYAIEVMVVGEPMSVYTKVPALGDYTDGYVQPEVHAHISPDEIVRISYRPGQPKTVYLAAMDGFCDLKPVCDSGLVEIRPYEDAVAWEEPVFEMIFDCPDGGDALIEVVSMYNTVIFYFEEE